MKKYKNLNRPITGNIKSVIKNLKTNKSSRPDSFAGEFYQTCKSELTSCQSSQPLLKIKEGTLPNSFYEPALLL